MKIQWSLIMGIVFALIVSIFAVINVDAVTVDFLFTKTSLPLIIIIIGSVLMGGLIIGSVGLYRIYKLQKEVKVLKTENELLKEKVEKSIPQEESEVESNDTETTKQ
jgi:lipopolysaccharide assembly protein A